MRTVVILASLSAAAFASAGDWPQWLGPNRDGTSAEIVKPWKQPPAVAWRVAVGEGHSSPIITGGRVFLHFKVSSKDEEQLSIYDAKSGKELGASVQPRKPFANPFGVGPRATPTVTADGQLITLGVTGVLNVQGSANNWIKDILQSNDASNLLFGVSASPLVIGDRVIVMPGGPGACLVAYKLANGDVAWKSLDDKASYSSPILIEQGGKKLIVALTAEGVVGVYADNGKLAWRYPFKDKLAESSTTPVKVGDRLIASSVTLGSVALELTTKDGQPAVTEAWKNPDLSSYFSTPIAIGDHLYMVTSAAGSLLGLPSVSLQCVETATGKICWTQKKVGRYHAALLRTGDNKLLMLCDSGDLVLVNADPKQYQELCRAHVCNETWAHPALADGKLYIRDARELICLQMD